MKVFIALFVVCLILFGCTQPTTDEPSQNVTNNNQINTPIQNITNDSQVNPPIQNDTIQPPPLNVTEDENESEDYFTSDIDDAISDLENLE